MRRRRNLIVALLLVVAMVVGVGYAALTRELLVTSTANLRAGEGFDVYFTNAAVTGGDAKYTAGMNAGTNMPVEEIATASYTATTANYSIIGLSQKNDYAEITYTITNESADLKAYLNSVAMTKGIAVEGEGLNGNADTVDEYFTKEVKLIIDGEETVLTDNMDCVTAPIYIPENGTATLVIHVSLNKTLGATVGGDTAAEHLTLTDAKVSLVFKETAPTNTP